MEALALRQRHAAFDHFALLQIHGFVQVTDGSSPMRSGSEGTCWKMNRCLNSVVKIDVEVKYKRIQLFVFLSDNFERRSEVQIIYLDGLNIDIL